MAITTNNLITWSEFTNLCLSNIKSVCCNIDGYKSDVPARLRAGQGQVAVRTIVTSVNAGGVAQTHTWYANPSNLISTVTTTQVHSEWDTFMAAAGINTRSNTLIHAQNLTAAVGLFMQFMSFHVKPVHSRRQIYNTIEAQTVYWGSKYVTGALTPKYVLNGMPTTAGAVTNADITWAIDEDFTVNQLLSKTQNPSISRYQLS